mmetsp:Transcript_27663/g.92933  ORF Transcript_27663/g.92933 Transcript_27663/m.92933 type:complete len:231 (+) Transcript_27663:670-1362(+)
MQIVRPDHSSPSNSPNAAARGAPLSRPDFKAAKLWTPVEASKGCDSMDGSGGASRRRCRCAVAFASLRASAAAARPSTAIRGGGALAPPTRLTSAAHRARSPRAQRSRFSASSATSTAGGASTTSGGGGSGGGASIGAGRISGANSAASDSASDVSAVSVLFDSVEREACVRLLDDTFEDDALQTDSSDGNTVEVAFEAFEALEGDSDSKDSSFDIDSDSFDSVSNEASS